MTCCDYKKLQNGSDIRGVALEGVAGELVNLSEEAVRRLSKAFVYWLSEKTEKAPSALTIAIGRDSRLSGESLRDWFAQTATETGVTILDAGLASTPAMFMSTLFSEFNADGSVMITASHLPFNRNGFKFFDKDGGLDKGDITDIIVFAESDSILERLPASSPPKIISVDLMERYSSHLRDMITTETGQSLPLSGMKITVDAGNGAGGFFAHKVLKPLGADISSGQFLDPDGNFPNHPPNPEDSAAMKSICDRVISSQSNLGLIFDTDVDRSGAVDENGKEINRNGIVAMAAALIAGEHPGTTIVTDSITSTQLTEFLNRHLQVSHLRFKRGYKNVINKSKELNENGIDSQLAIETSGHAAYKDNFFLDDGAYLATKITIEASRLFNQGRGISTLIAGLTEPAESREVRFPINSPDFAIYADRILDDLKNWVSTSGSTLGWTLAEPNYEGVRVEMHGDVKGWFLLRKSLHDPIMPLNIESEETGGIENTKKLLKKFFETYEDLDISAM